MLHQVGSGSFCDRECPEVFRRVADHTVRLAAEEWLRHQRQDPVHRGSCGQRGDIPVCRLLLHGDLPEALMRLCR